MNDGSVEILDLDENRRHDVISTVNDVIFVGIFASSIFVVSASLGSFVAFSSVLSSLKQIIYFATENKTWYGPKPS